VGLPELHFRDLRRTGNTMAAAQRASLKNSWSGWVKLLSTIEPGFGVARMWHGDRFAPVTSRHSNIEKQL
jgi:hypothetical protein